MLSDVRELQEHLNLYGGVGVPKKQFGAGGNNLLSVPGATAASFASGLPTASSFASSVGTGVSGATGVSATGSPAGSPAGSISKATLSYMNTKEKDNVIMNLATMYERRMQDLDRSLTQQIHRLQEELEGNMTPGARGSGSGLDTSFGSG